MVRTLEEIASSRDSFLSVLDSTAKQIEAVATAGREVRRVQAEALTKIKGGLRAVYRTLELPGANPLKDAHAALDATVRSNVHRTRPGRLIAKVVIVSFFMGCFLFGRFLLPFFVETRTRTLCCAKSLLEDQREPFAFPG
jgi:hypothetical protein